MRITHIHPLDTAPPEERKQAMQQRCKACLRQLARRQREQHR